MCGCSHAGGQKVTRYEFYAAVDDGRPLRLHQIGNDLFSGSHFDEVGHVWVAQACLLAVALYCNQAIPTPCIFDEDTCCLGSITRSSWHTVRVAQLLRCLQSLRSAPVQLLKGLRAHAELLCAWCVCYLACARVSRVTRSLIVCNYTLESPLEK